MSRRSNHYENSIVSCDEHITQFKEYTDEYKEEGSLEKYIGFLNSEMRTSKMSMSAKRFYLRLIQMYKEGNKEPLLQSLYEKVLYWDNRKIVSNQKLKAELNGENSWPSTSF